MKRSLLTTLLAGILVVSGGCGQEPTAPTREGALFGTLDGAEWVGNAQSDILGETIEIRSRRQNVNGEQWMNVRAVETSPGVFAVITAAMSDHPSNYSETVGLDVLVYKADVIAGTIAFQQLDRERGVMRRDALAHPPGRARYLAPGRGRVRVPPVAAAVGAVGPHANSLDTEGAARFSALRLSAAPSRFRDRRSGFPTRLARIPESG